MSKMKVLNYLQGGNSTPLIIEDDGNKRLVKLAAGMSGAYSVLSEWIGNKLGQELGINTRIPQWINLTHQLEYAHVNIEIRDLIEKSLGLNISFDYLESPEEINLIDLDSYTKSDYINAYLLDVFMLNIDRTEVNLNLMRTKDASLLFSDFESSLIFNELLSGQTLTTNPGIFGCLKGNPFYQKVPEQNLEQFIEQLNKVDFDALIAAIPTEIIDDKLKQHILEVLKARKNKNWALRPRLMAIDNTHLETEEEKNKRIRANREQLEQRIKQNKQ